MSEQLGAGGDAGGPAIAGSSSSRIRFKLIYLGRSGNYLTVSIAQDDCDLESRYAMLLLQRIVIRHWRMSVFMVIIETSFFTRRITSLMSDDEYLALQQALIIRPDTGPIIQGTGGLRKVRWRMDGRGLDR